MINLAFLSTALFWAFIFCSNAYNIFLALMSLKRSKRPPRHEPFKKFACLIPAHNEENVIGALIDSLQNQNYPKHLYNVFVVADRCDDHTVKMAERKSAHVFKRSRGSEGKGAVVRFFLGKLFNELHEERFDAVCFFDADNLVHTDFLQRMNDALCEGQKCIQGYLGVKNPKDNWVTKAIYASYLTTNRLWQLSKESLGLSAACGGTGFCVTTDLLRQYGWPAKTLTEDLEMEIFYNLKRTRVSWLHDAIVYDEKPRSLRIALKKYFVKLVVRSAKTRDFNLLDQAFYLLSPLYWFAVLFLTIMGGLELVAHVGIFQLGAIEAIILGILVVVTYQGAGIYLETRSLKDLTIILFTSIFVWIWVLALILALKDLNQKKWFYTPHGC